MATAVEVAYAVWASASVQSPEVASVPDSPEAAAPKLASVLAEVAVAQQQVVPLESAGAAQERRSCRHRQVD